MSPELQAIRDVVAGLRECDVWHMNEGWYFQTDPRAVKMGPYATLFAAVIEACTIRDPAVIEAIRQALANDPTVR